MACVKSGNFGNQVKFGQRHCFFHILIIGMKKIIKQTVKILSKRLCMSELTCCPKQPEFTIYRFTIGIIFLYYFQVILRLLSCVPKRAWNPGARSNTFPRHSSYCITTLWRMLANTYAKKLCVRRKNLRCCSRKLHSTVLPVESDSDAMLCLQSYKGLRINRSLVY